MKNFRRTDELQINQDLVFQRRSWKAQRVGWVVMLLFVLAEAIGLLGPGIVSHTTIASPTLLLQVEYDRLIRLHAPTRLKIQATPAISTSNSSDRKIQIQFSREYLEQFQIAHILPEPEEVIVQPQDLLYRFLISNSEQAITIVIDLEPEQVGWTMGEIALGADSKVQLKQWIYP